MRRPYLPWLPSNVLDKIINELVGEPAAGPDEQRTEYDNSYIPWPTPQPAHPLSALRLVNHAFAANETLNTALFSTLTLRPNFTQAALLEDFDMARIGTYVRKVRFVAHTEEVYDCVLTTNHEMACTIPYHIFRARGETDYSVGQRFDSEISECLESEELAAIWTRILKAMPCLEHVVVRSDMYRFEPQQRPEHVPEPPVLKPKMLGERLRGNANGSHSDPGVASALVSRVFHCFEGLGRPFPAGRLSLDLRDGAPLQWDSMDFIADLDFHNLHTLDLSTGTYLKPCILEGLPDLVLGAVGKHVTNLTFIRAFEHWGPEGEDTVCFAGLKLPALRTLRVPKGLEMGQGGFEAFLWGYEIVEVIEEVRMKEWQLKKKLDKGKKRMAEDWDVMRGPLVEA